MWEVIKKEHRRSGEVMLDESDGDVR